MAQTSNRLLDELARLATDAVGAAQGVRREVETVARSQIERILRDMDIATREEVDVLRDLVGAGGERGALRPREGPGGAARGRFRRKAGRARQAGDTGLTSFRPGCGETVAPVDRRPAVDCGPGTNPRS